MNNIDSICEKYCPYKITKKGKCTIIYSMEGNFVIKENSNIKDIYKYLDSRQFYNHPKLIDDLRNDINISEYIEDYDYPKEQKLNDMIDLVIDMHNKTKYVKEVTEDNYKEIYENIKNNIEYYEYKYNNLIKEIEKERFMSPSKYLFIRNSSKILNALKYSKETINNWYLKVKEKHETTISLIHNNLRIDHFIKKDNGYLISFDNAKIDSPILDIYRLYKVEFENNNINNSIRKYIDNTNMEELDRDLLFSMLAIVENIKFDKDEFTNVVNIDKKINYLYKVEELIRSYSIENKIEE